METKKYKIRKDLSYKHFIDTNFIVLRICWRTEISRRELLWFTENENLSQEGNCWVYLDGKSMTMRRYLRCCNDGFAQVCDNAIGIWECTSKRSFQIKDNAMYLITYVLKVTLLWRITHKCTVKLSNENEPRLAVPSCHGRRWS